jgi:hypothetical protein
VRRTHHNAFEHGLASHEGFLAALERGQQLDRYKKSPQCSPKAHVDWMILPAAKHQK